MSKRLIGYGYTNANGVATLDYDAEGNELSSSGYVGTGAGVVNLSVETEIDGSIVSEIYEVLDCIFKEIGDETTHPSWTDSNLTPSYEDGAVILTPSSTFCTRYKGFTIEDMVFEFDVCSTYSTGTNIFSFRQGSTATNSFGQSALGLQSEVWYTVRFEIQNGYITPFVNGVEVTAQKKAIVDTPNRFYFVLDNTQLTNLKYKNFKVYPI